MSTAAINKNLGLVEAAIEIENRRRNTLILARLEADKGNLSEVQKLLRELVPDEALSGVVESFNDGPSRRGSGVVAFPKSRKPANG